MLRRLKCERGVAMVEFALVLPLLLLLILGMTDFGKAFNYWVDETHLANEGARIAAVACGGTTCPNGNLAQYIQSQADTAELRNGGTQWLPQKAQVCITLPQNPATGTSGQLGDPVQVTVTATYHWLPLVANALPRSLQTATIQGTSTMRLEAAASLTSGLTGCSS
jgi:Flp pilus assembly protein TadG